MTKYAESKSAEHRINLAEQWGVWRCMGLRGAGFPATDVLRLSAPEAARAADSVLQAQERVAELRAEALKLVNDELDAMRRTGQWDNKDKRAPLLDALRQLKAGKAVRALQVEQIDRAVRAYEDARICAVEAEEDLKDVYKISQGHVSEAVRHLAGNDRLCEAITWQNRNALHTAIDALLRKPLDVSKRGSKQRQYEELIANYLQRYCVKNDTIGFFGPVGWAKIGSGFEPLAYKAGANLLAARKVYFEEWCINEIATKLAKNKSLKPWMIPIRIPRFHLEGLALHSGLGSQTISEEQAFILTACDGNRTAIEIAREFCNTTGRGEEAERQVYETLAAFEQRGVIFWGIYIPLDTFPEESLRKSLNRIEREDLRRAGLSMLDELEQARSGVARAAGNASMLDRALGNLEATFERLTGAESTRAAGETYAARTLVYEDCRRDLEVTLSSEMIRELGEPLSLLLTSARWLTVEVAKAYGEKVTELYRRTVQRTGSPVVDWTRLWAQFQPYAFDSALLDGVMREFQERWQRILSPSFDSKRLSYTSAQLRLKILSEFDAARPGWKGAHFHSPDIMLAASGPDAIKRGDYQFVMGELHLGSNTLTASLFTAQHESPETLRRAVEIDLQGSRVVPVMPKNWPKATARTTYSLITPGDIRLEFGWDAFATDRSKALPAASLVFEEGADGLVARTRDGRLRFSLTEIFDAQLTAVAIDVFKILKPQKHTPRLTIDKLVAQRETWRFDAEDLDFAYEKDDVARFVAARSWARAHGMPRFVFAKVPAEVKPFYVDFNSPIYVDVFSKIIRKTRDLSEQDKTGDPKQNVTVSEMLPLVDQSWLQDSEGHRFTSEFRLVVVDLA
jgi:hypothetical protein